MDVPHNSTLYTAEQSNLISSVRYNIKEERSDYTLQEERTNLRNPLNDSSVGKPEYVNDVCSPSFCHVDIKMENFEPEIEENQSYLHMDMHCSNDDFSRKCVVEHNKQEWHSAKKSDVYVKTEHQICRRDYEGNSEHVANFHVLQPSPEHGPASNRRDLRYRLKLEHDNYPKNSSGNSHDAVKIKSFQVEPVSQNDVNLNNLVSSEYVSSSISLNKVKNEIDIEENELVPTEEILIDVGSLMNNLKTEVIENQSEIEYKVEREQMYLDTLQICPTMDQLKRNSVSSKESYGVQHSLDASDIKSNVVRRKGDKKFKCKICSKNFLSLVNLNKHIGVHLEEKKFECKICNKKFSYKSALKCHEVSHTGEKLFTCEICNKKFGHSSHLKLHEIVHTGEKRFECKVCNKKFGQSAHLRSHEVMHTGERRFECKICNKKFGQSSHLKCHEVIHTGEKRYECKICNKKFGLSSHLRLHEVVHSGEKRFECKICNKRFSQSSSLKIHKALHSEVKLFECKFCNKKFGRNDYLKAHEIVHTGEKRFECEICHKKFGHNSSLKIHKIVHIGKKRFECKFCNKKYSRGYTLKAHELIHTREITSGV